MGSSRTVGLVIESARAYGRGLLRGIARYARADGRWTLLHQEWGLNDGPPAWLKKGSCDGIIARIETRQLLTSLRKLKVPIVDLRRLHRHPGMPAIGNNDQMTARMAADHLLNRGLRNLGYCGIARAEYSEARLTHFVACLQDRGHVASVYEGTADPHARTTAARESDAMLHEDELAEWLRSLPKPAGIMACNDIRGRQVLSACRRLGLAVPGEVAVIGVDNDEVLCDLADPPLSSIALSTERMGYEAASLLNRLMDGEAAPAGDMFIDPVGVVTRVSTDVLAVDDPHVSAALRFIHGHAIRGIAVDDVLDHLASKGPAPLVSRSTLERRFDEVLNRSPKQEILRVRLERARELLLDTDLTLNDIADAIGMAHPEQLNVLFKRQTGETPGTFRRRMSVRRR